ncbi:MAG: hypothetical protein LBS97_02720, partial [Treponema sp.]|nr:hypothetical protein [Treponema sp.]
FNELEGVDFSGKPVSVLVLFDRIAGYDATNGDWTDTRLYEITTDPNGNNALMMSKRLDCPDLGLSSTAITELDMSDSLVLSRLISFAKREYAANNYGLIVWGHGTGWRGSGTMNAAVPAPLKAIAFDDSTGHYMTLPSFGTAVSGKGLSVIGFDTCFSALLEVAYQIKDSGAQYMVGSPGVIPSNGWDYQALFTSFFGKSALTSAVFCDCVVTQFKNQYSGTNGANISRIKLSEVTNLFNAFEYFAGLLAQGITAASRQMVLNALLNSTDAYYFSPPSDYYVDILDFAQTMVSLGDSLTTNTALKNNIANAGTALESALNAAVTSSWSAANIPHPLGIYVTSLTAPGVPAASHPAEYIRGSMESNKSAFVENSIHWAPNQTPSAASLLDKLFYLSD